jgi:hypothetical protein
MGCVFASGDPQEEQQRKTMKFGQSLKVVLINRKFFLDLMVALTLGSVILLLGDDERKIK